MDEEEVQVRLMLKHDILAITAVKGFSSPMILCVSGSILMHQMITWEGNAFCRSP